MWLQDSYTFVAGDAVAAHAGRGYNVLRGQFETTSGRNLTPAGGEKRARPYRLKHISAVIRHAGGGAASGIFLCFWVVVDPIRTVDLKYLRSGLISAYRELAFEVDTDLMAGVQITIPIGGIIATDYLNWGLEYE
jgi:hypothetical protein